MASLKVLGLDPGTRLVGYALIERAGTRLSLCEAGVIRADLKAHYAARLATIHRDLCALIERLQPDQAAMESAFVGRNPRTALKIGEGRGIALAALSACGREVAEYTPATIKRAATGQGGASKQQVARMIALQLGLKELPKPEDATDACAVALCHLARSRR